jgi:hypothetical protein
MNTINHTPGPWIVGSLGTSVLACTPVDNVDSEVTSKPFPVVCDTVSCDDGMSYGEAAANARLIAAAPELLAALREIADIDAITHNLPDKAADRCIEYAKAMLRIGDCARAALAKAGAL